MNTRSLPRAAWRFFCSLKLAIVLASAATLLTMVGSLVMHFNPAVFGNMDTMILGKWLRTAGAGAPGLTWWLKGAGIFIVLLGINTLCCFIDWAGNFHARWRKSGEYLIHLGFVLVLVAYIWGSLSGFRSTDNRLQVGEKIKIDEMPGFSLRLEAFEPVFNDSGRPVDMRSTVSLLRQGKTVARQVVKTNSPLTYKGLIVVPGSFGRIAEGFNFFLSGHGQATLTPGTTLPLDDGGSLRVVRFLPDAVRRRDGQTVPRSSRLGNPAIELEVIRPDTDPWRGWYFLREGLPFPLVSAGVRLWPTDPIYRYYSILTVNRDPGALLALVGSLAMLTGVLFAMGSFYYKRARGDRPDIA